MSDQQDLVLLKARKFVLIIGQIVLVGLFLAAYAARYVHPQYGWWLQLIALGLPILSVLVVALAVAFAFAGRWGIACAYLPLLILISLRFLPSGVAGMSPSRSVASSPDSVLTVMTFNAKLSGRSGGDASAAFDTLIARERPEVLALQEANMRFLNRAGQSVIPGHLGRALINGDYRSLRPDEIEPGYSISKPVFVQGGTEQQTERFLGVQSVGSGTQSLVRAEVEWGGRRVAVYNLHLRSFNSQRLWDNSAGEGHVKRWIKVLRSYREDFLLRATEAERIATILSEESLPFLVCGDFNSTRHQWAYWQIAEGFRDVLDSSMGAAGYTYPAHRPVVGIDHILMSEDWGLVSAYVPQTVLSDHRPVVAQVVLVDRN